ncbi:hypothetical protein OH492_21865 [Vibrio chagasii]|nr:hypothetical protein [Vibrio chagasii]
MTWVKITPHVTVFVGIDHYSSRSLLSEDKRRHIGAFSRTINRKETQACGWGS